MKWQVDVAAQIGDFELDAAIAGEATPTVLVGPNGAGKTTLLRLIAGVHRPARGRIQVGERALFDARQHVDLPPEQRRVGYVPQGYGLFPHLRVIDNVAFGLAYTQVGPRAARRRVALEWLERLECAALAPRMPAELSGGERQRVALARALAVQPEILLLDEPLAALDAAARRGMRSFLAAHLAARSEPSVIVTHDLRDVLALDGSVCVLEGGRVAQRGTASELAQHPATAFVEELFSAIDRVPGKS